MRGVTRTKFKDSKKKNYLTSEGITSSREESRFINIYPSDNSRVPREIIVATLTPSITFKLQSWHASGIGLTYRKIEMDYLH